MTEVRRSGDRLILFRFSQKLTLPDVGVFISDIKVALGDVVKNGHRALSAGDLRLTGILTPDVADALVGLLKGDNPYIEKTAAVVGNATFGLQVERMFREAGNPARQTFRASEDLVRFFAPQLTPAEVTTLREWFHDEQR